MHKHICRLWGHQCECTWQCERQKAESFSLVLLLLLFCEFVTACYLLSLQLLHTGMHTVHVDEGFRGIWASLAHVQLYEEVPVWSPSGLRKWSRCKASGSRNPVGHLPCCSCTALCQILKDTYYHLPVWGTHYNMPLHSDFPYCLWNICVMAFILLMEFCFMFKQRTSMAALKSNNAWRVHWKINLLQFELFLKIWMGLIWTQFTQGKANTRLKWENPVEEFIKFLLNLP